VVKSARCAEGAGMLRPARRPVWLWLVCALTWFSVFPALSATTARETPGLTRTDGKSEQRLLEVLGLMSRGENRDALAKAEKLVADHPNFQLAQLIYGDLLTARTRALQTIGDMPAETARAGAAALSDLREETQQRMTGFRDRPPEGFIPSAFLKVSPQAHSAIAVDASRSRLYFSKTHPVVCNCAPTTTSRWANWAPPKPKRVTSAHLWACTLSAAIWSANP